jgi:heat-inducible transcriptional repressor
MSDELDPRAQKVLRAIIQEHISGGEPVGSQALSRRSDLEVSPATIRAVMADLEALGFLEKPHTSAGRVPTDRGYRFYVDALVRLRPPGRKEKERIERAAHEPGPGPGDIERTLQDFATTLHELTRYAGVVVTPRLSSDVLRAIEFVKLREGRVLAVLVTSSGAVENRVLTLPDGEQLSQADLDRAAAALNGLLADLPLHEVRERIVQEMARARGEYDRLLERALSLGQAALAPGAPATTGAGSPGLLDADALRAIRSVRSVSIRGQAALLEEPEFADVERLRALFRTFEEKEQLLQLFDRALQGRGVQIFIGAESGLGEARDLAVVASPYGTGGAGAAGARPTPLGTIGIIGPTRMDYARIIPLVEYTAAAIGRILEGG